ncbi:uncharacterized protein LOC122685281 isoform X2 [Cervus elaphus]|uniref:uncharacterized protein LOC122422599 isoform X2 n=1 Tax=Cervus canadensis TaxID=1574408 RepID=UPI001CA30376|nr:uncharacterized protein LOC122422599 isoform X2 [Cervus canadensis]XP_043745821.1 uncharacterized protein LOC122685281 isoform X2 [Cervus elaphus]
MQRSQEGARAAAWLDGMGTLWRGQAGVKAISRVLRLGSEARCGQMADCMETTLTLARVLLSDGWMTEWILEQEESMGQTGFNLAIQHR